MSLSIVPKKLFLCILVCTLTACASSDRTQPSASDDRVASDIDTVTVPEVNTDAQDLAEILAEVAAESSQTRQLSILIEALAAKQEQGEWQTSALLLSELRRFTHRLSESQQRQIRFAEAQWFASQKQWQAAEQSLAPLLASTDVAPATLRLARDLAVQMRQPQQAAQYQLDYLAAAAEAESSDVVWSVLRDAHQPQQLTATGDLASGWLALLQAAHEQAKNEDVSAIQGWQLRYRSHPAQAVAQVLQQNLQPLTSQVALVLLPLSGQFAEQGQAVLDGMILALSELPQLQIVVRDTANFDFITLSEEVQRTQADIVIGPLLKDNVSKVDGAALEQTTTPWFALNNASELGTSPTMWFALEPEWEIAQIAHTLVERGYQKPLVLAADSNSGRSAVNNFTEAFRALQPEATIESGYYRTPEDMKTIVQEKLGVSASDARIWQVKIAAGKILVDAEPRSREDFDVIFLPGNIEQTRLLKPFIDVNISPFNQRIPVYATSASHILRDQLSENDLNEVHFTEAPWLVPGHPRSNELNDLLALRKSWGYSLARLAAFGHDAILLSRHRHVLAALPGFRLAGLTGELYGSPTALQRELDWAQYDGHKVVAE